MAQLPSIPHNSGLLSYRLQELSSHEYFHYRLIGTVSFRFMRPSLYVSWKYQQVQSCTSHNLHTCYGSYPPYLKIQGAIQVAVFTSNGPARACLRIDQYLLSKAEMDVCHEQIEYWDDTVLILGEERNYSPSILLLLCSHRRLDGKKLVGRSSTSLSPSSPEQAHSSKYEDPKPNP